jgi:choline dehydrogenase-like flavoprotein
MRQVTPKMRQFTPATDVDFVVVGAGAAGGIMAQELSIAGFTVVVLEQGGWGCYGHEQDYNKDELLDRSYPDEANTLTSTSPLRPNTFRRTEKDTAQRGSHSYGMCVGGGTVTYGGSSWRHLPYEFNELSYDETIPSGTGMADWPISYAEIEPYYVKAEWDLGICGPQKNLPPMPMFGPMSRPYPVGPQPIKSSGALFKIAAKKLGLTTCPNVCAIITERYQGRDACVNCSWCSGYGCHVRARSSSAVTNIPRALATGRCEVRAHSYVREVTVDNSGRVAGVTYFDAQKREVFQRAKAVVVSANASESARLLLMSKSNRFANGLANSSGLVGKYLMTGNSGGATGYVDRPMGEYKGGVTGLAILDYVPSDPKRGFYGGGRITARGQANPIAYGMAGAPNAPSWGAGYKKALEEYADRRIVCSNFITQMPLITNYVDLDPDVKDAWGLPAMRITMQSHPNDIKAIEFFQKKSVEILEAAGCKQVMPLGPPSDSRGGAHNRGTCRMGSDPRTSVVDKYHRAHDVPNLYIVDGSSLVTGGRNHPTMTLQALAYRAAEHLIKAAKSGSVPTTL